MSEIEKGGVNLQKTIGDRRRRGVVWGTLAIVCLIVLGVGVWLWLAKSPLWQSNSASVSSRTLSTEEQVMQYNSQFISIHGTVTAIDLQAKKLTVAVDGASQIVLSYDEKSSFQRGTNPDAVADSSVRVGDSAYVSYREDTKHLESAWLQ